jgi:hypothetical protein
MFTWITTLVIGFLLAVVVFFTWANWATSRIHARFQSKDVEEALAEVLSPDAETHETFDMFLSWPIDDPRLESIRQQCLSIIKETDPPPAGEDLSDEALKRIASLLEDLRTPSEP